MELSFVFCRIILECWIPEFRDSLTHHGDRAITRRKSVLDYFEMAELDLLMLTGNMYFSKTRVLFNITFSMYT